MSSRISVRTALSVCAAALLIRFRGQRAPARSPRSRLSRRQASTSAHRQYLRLRRRHLDLDQDGAPDIISVGDAAGGVKIWQNDGNGFFTDRSLVPGLQGSIPARSTPPSPPATTTTTETSISTSPLMASPTSSCADSNWTWTMSHQKPGSTPRGLRHLGGLRRRRLARFLPRQPHRNLFVGNGPALQENRLYRNNGDGTFTDVAVQMNVHDPGTPSRQLLRLQRRRTP